MLLRTMSLAFFATALAFTTGCARSETAPSAEKSEKAADTSEKTAEPIASAIAKGQSEPASSEPTHSVARQDEPTTTTDIGRKPAPVAEAAPAPAEKPAATTTATTTTAAVEPAAAPAAPAQKQITKADIINSTDFRRAMFEFNEWLSGQPIYTPQQVAQIKDQFNHRVAEMNAQELAYLLADLEEKMQIINTPASKEARAWMAQYLSVMSDKKKAQTLKDVPNVATMTAAQLSAEIAKIQETRDQMDSEQASFERGQALQVANQIQTDRRNQQNYVNDWNNGPVSYSPYRNGSNVNDRLNEGREGSGMGFYVSPLGGVGMSFSPSSW